MKIEFVKIGKNVTTQPNYNYTHIQINFTGKKGRNKTKHIIPRP